jgi:hypothetical protein
MNAAKVSPLKRMLRARGFPPAGMVARALLIALAFGVCHLLGWREHTTFLSGTAASADASLQRTSTLGVIYLVAYFGFVLLTPILILAAMLLKCAERVRRKPTSGQDPLS